MRLISFFFFQLLLYHGILSQQIIFGTNSYIEYHEGTLPIVISVPHGGNVTPDSIPDRTCNNPTLVTDTYTQEVAQQINLSLFDITGCYAHIIYCNLKRTKLDCNRNIGDGACGNIEAEKAWEEFHHFIDSAQAIVNEQFHNKGFYIDLHAHGHSIQQIELGYLLNNTELDFSDSILNSPPYKTSSSIKNLVYSNVNSYSHSELLRGAQSLGSLLENKYYPAVPSYQTPFPGINNPFFSGGYSTVNHTCYSDSLELKRLNGVQMELNYTGIRDNALNRETFGDSLSLVLLDYMDIHMGVLTNNCMAGSVALRKNEILVYPNPTNGVFWIETKNKYNKLNISLTSVTGALLFSLQTPLIKKKYFNLDVEKGIYFLDILDVESGDKQQQLIVIN